MAVYGISEGKNLVEVLSKTEAATKQDVMNTTLYRYVGGVNVIDESSDSVIVDFPFETITGMRVSVIIQDLGGSAFTEVVIIPTELSKSNFDYIQTITGNIDVRISDYNFDDINAAWVELTIHNPSSNLHSYAVYIKQG